jgi:hypothetical protein
VVSRGPGPPAAARAAVDRALDSSLRTGERLYLAETYRIRAAITRATDPESDDEVRRDLVQAIDCAREQGAVVFELRAALDLVALGGDTTGDVGRVREAAGRFPDGADCAELDRARPLLTTT